MKVNGLRILKELCNLVDSSWIPHRNDLLRDFSRFSQDMIGSSYHHRGKIIRLSDINVDVGLSSEMKEAYYGYMQAKFFTIGFLKISGKLVKLGFYKSLEDFEKEVSEHQPAPRLSLEAFEDLLRDLESYLSGRRVSFNHPFQLQGTSFQKKILKTVRKIPYGATRSYKWVAELVGRPRAYRAVANTLARNPLALIIPCHRVVRNDGRIAGSGFGRKVREYLLRLEGAIK